MAKARKCDICGSHYDIDFCDSLGASVRYPNRIHFYVNYLDDDDCDKITTHFPEVNPARTALSGLDTDYAKYDVCPNCMGEITSLIGKLYSKRNVKEVKN